MMIKNNFTYFSIIVVFIISACSNDRQGKGKDSQQLTYSEHIAPIIYKNCSPCHRPGSGAPFDLITFDDVKGHLKTV